MGLIGPLIPGRAVIQTSPRGGQGNHGTLARRVTIPPCRETHTLTAATSAELSAESPPAPRSCRLGHQRPGRRRAAHRLLPRNALSLTAVFDGPGVTHDDGGGVVAWGVRAEDVIAVPDMLDGARVRHWVGGGWGVAALTGRQTREHRDLDLAVDARDLERCWPVLGQLDYAAETDWLPVRMELRAPGARWVDVHPVHFDADGHGRQPDLDGGHFDYPPSAFTTGSIGGRTVPCLSAEQQRRFRTGYEHRRQDIHDLAELDALQRKQKPPT
jgi:lincosamide nucleotidyltransferase A/C/D/E